MAQNKCQSVVKQSCTNKAKNNGCRTASESADETDEEMVDFDTIEKKIFEGTGFLMGKNKLRLSHTDTKVSSNSKEGINMEYKGDHFSLENKSKNISNVDLISVKCLPLEKQSPKKNTKRNEFSKSSASDILKSNKQIFNKLKTRQTLQTSNPEQISKVSINVRSNKTLVSAHATSETILKEPKNISISNSKDTQECSTIAIKDVQLKGLNKTKKLVKSLKLKGTSHSSKIVSEGNSSHIIKVKKSNKNSQNSCNKYSNNAMLKVGTPIPDKLCSTNTRYKKSNVNADMSQTIRSTPTTTRAHELKLKTSLPSSVKSKTSDKAQKVNVKVNSSVVAKKKSSSSGRCHKTNLELSVPSSKQSSAASKKKNKCPSRVKGQKADVHHAASDSEASDWEDVVGEDNTGSKQDEVTALTQLVEDSQSDLKTENVQIELEAPTLWGSKKRKHKSHDELVEEFLRRQMNQHIRDSYINCHKVHLLLLLGRGRIENSLLNSQEMLGAALSIITSQDVYPPKRINLGYIEQIIKWFGKKVKLVVEEPLEDGYWDKSLEEILQKRFEVKRAKTNREYVFMFVLISRALGMTVRLIKSLNPLHWRPTMQELFKPPPKTSEREDEFGNTSKCNSENNLVFTINSESIKKIKDQTKDEANDVIYIKNKNGRKGASSNVKRKQSYEDLSSESDSDFEEKQSNKSNKSKRKVVRIDRNKHEKNIPTSSKSTTASRGGSGSKRSPSIEGGTESKRRKVESLAEWVEVYVEEEERWICVDVIHAGIHCAKEIVSRAAGVTHATAYGQDQSVKDVTRRYVEQWLAQEGKLRCCSAWWTRCLVPLAPPHSSREADEEQQLEERLTNQSLPTVFSQYKNHPLYCIERHLLKFEGLYPPLPERLGTVRGEAVYPRTAVRMLRSRDTWLKEAMTVMDAQEPYKVVKARPKWDKVLLRSVAAPPLELFGDWQVEDYKPPMAKDGKVPRNQYGNVELFKPSMMPGGCVHLGAQYEDIGRIARKLGIDAALAMTGFDFHCGFTHPVFSGYIVCVENRDILVDAWHEEMALKRQRERLKRQRRVCDNWKRLVHGLLVRNHVRERYGGGSDDDDADDDEIKIIAVTKSTKTVQKKRKKIKQEDLDNARLETTTKAKEKIKLGIDFQSDTVSMARKNLKYTLKSRGMVDRDTESVSVINVERMVKNEVIVPEKEDRISDSDDEVKETEEETREKMQKFLAWNDSKLSAVTNLSDYSDLEDDKEFRDTVPERSSVSSTSQMVGSTTNIFLSRKHQSFNKKKRGRRLESNKDDSSNKEELDSTTSESDDFEYEINQARQSDETRTSTSRPRRTCRRRDVLDDHSDVDDVTNVTLEDSDVEDKTYEPQ